MAFRKKVCKSIEEVQNDLDEWLHYYNNKRIHQGKNCEGLTPMECFRKHKHFAQTKMIGYNPNINNQIAMSDNQN